MINLAGRSSCRQSHRKLPIMPRSFWIACLSLVWKRLSPLSLVAACLTAAMTLGSCAFLNQMAETPTVSFSGLRLLDASLLESTLDFRFKIDNPNPVTLHTGKISYNLKLNGKQFARGRLDQGIILPAGNATLLSVPVLVRYLDVYETMAEMVRARQTAYDMNGTLDIGPLRIPIQARGVLELPQLPTLSLEAVHIRQMSFSGASLNCQLKIDNPNAFDLAVKKFDYKLQLGDLPIAQASGQPTAPVPQSGSSVIGISFDVSFARLGRSAYDLFQRPESTYRIDGRMLFDAPTGGIKIVPFTTFGKITMKR
jgi:LEA14-like dessication related protein